MSYRCKPSPGPGPALSNFEQDLVFDDGRVVTIQGSAAPLFDDRGKVRGVVGACVDITERKRAEEALRAADAARMSSWPH